MSNDNGSTGAAQAALAAGLGMMVWWSLREVDVPRGELRAVFERLGIGKAVPRDPRPSAVLSRACREALVGQGGEWQFDRVKDDVDCTVAVLTHRVTDASLERVDFAPAGSIRVEKSTGKVSGKNEPLFATLADPILVDCARRFNHVTAHATTEDLRAALTNAMRGRRRDLLIGAVEVNGVFFVRENQRATVEALQKWVTGRSFGEVSVLTVQDDAASRTQVVAGTTRTIEARVTELLVEAKEIAERVRNADEDEIDRILVPYLDRFQLAESAADLYADVLGNAQANLKAAIKAARDEFAVRIVGAA